MTVPLQRLTVADAEHDFFAFHGQRLSDKIKLFGNKLVAEQLLRFPDLRKECFFHVLFIINQGFWFSSPFVRPIRSLCAVLWYSKIPFMRSHRFAVQGLYLALFHGNIIAEEFAKIPFAYEAYARAVFFLGRCQIMLLGNFLTCDFNKFCNGKWRFVFALLLPELRKYVWHLFSSLARTR